MHLSSISKSDRHQNIITIFRKSHNTENPYSLISKSVLLDKNLSIKARGLISHLLAMPDDWKVINSNLQKSVNLGKHALSTGFNELMKFGYLQIIQNRNVDGTFSNRLVTVYEDPKLNPKFQNLKILQPTKSGPLPGYPAPDNQPLLNTNNTNNIININTTIVGSTNTHRKSEVVVVDVKQGEINKLSDHVEKSEIRIKILAMKKANELHSVYKGKSVEQFVDEIYYHVINRDKNKVYTPKKSINAACKMIREGRWGIPKGLIIKQQESKDRCIKIEKEKEAIDSKILYSIIDQHRIWFNKNKLGLKN